MTTFDLSEPARQKYQQDRGMRNFAFVVVLAMLVFAVLGGFLVARDLATPPNSAGWFGALALLVGPTALAVGFGLLFRATRPGPTRLVILDESVSFEGSPHKKDVRLAWGDPRLALTMYDLSAMERVSQRSGRTRAVDFVVLAKTGYQAAVSQAPFEAIIAAAKEHRLKVDGDAGPLAEPASARIIKIHH
jgi:hypothetical protein